MKIYFVRHLKTKGNYEKRYIGRTDEDLDFSREQSVNYSLPKLPNKIYCSPMKRCVQTAQAIYPDADILFHNNLREVNFGIFENKAYEELKENVHYRNFISGLEDPIEGEGRLEFKERCFHAFSQIISECKEEDILVIVCHGGTIMTIMEKLEQSKGGFYDYQIPNGGVLECEFDGENLRIVGRG
ncbi:MAG: histidine phosphatase family protein [Eubacteriales bacterium]